MKYLYLLCATTVALLHLQPIKAEVYQWLGHTPDWHDAGNWHTSGRSIVGIPGSDDDVIISGRALGTALLLNRSAEVASITIADHRDFRFSSTGEAVLRVNGSLHLSESTTVGGGLRIALTAATGHYACADAVLPFLEIANRQGYQRGEPLLSSTRGSCAFFTIVPQVTNPTCNGFSNGVAGVATPTDGVGPYIYQWVGGPTTQTWTGLGAGTYTVIVIDQGQFNVPCSQDIFVNEPGPLTVFAMNASPPSCAGVCDGSADPIIIGGNGGYQINWSSGETGPSATALCATFTLTVTDQLDCVFVNTFTDPNAPDPVALTAAVTDVQCAGDNDGTIDLTVTGGVGGFTISWTGPGGFTSNSSALTNLAPGTYTAIAEDTNGCTGTESFVIAEAPVLSATAALTPNTCSDGTEGAIVLTPTGGTTPYSFSWSGPGGFSSSDQSPANLATGTYLLTLTDDNGCVYNNSYTIAAPPAIDITATIVDVLCFEATTGSLSANATGGTGSYTYSWIGPGAFAASGPVINNLAASTYEVTVTDASLCTSSATFEVQQPNELQVELTGQQVSCVGESDGSISTTVSGGVDPYSFAWTGPGGYNSNDQNPSSLQAGTYNLTLTDANLCSIASTVEVPNDTVIVVTGNITQPTCSSGNTGAIDLTVSGGLEPFVFAWTGPSGFNSTSQNIANLAAGTYTAVVTDDGGCSVTSNFNITPPPALNATFVITPNSCFGGNTGAITTSPTGGTSPYTFLWLGPAGFFSTLQNISGLLAGTYTLQITDANGCQGFVNAVVPQPTQINVTRVITNVTCFGGSNGAINITVSGGTPGYTFNWSGPGGFTATTEDITGVIAGSYVVAVTDANGCTVSRTYNITQPIQITLNGNVTNVTCAGNNDGAISVSVATGAGPFTWSWTGPGGFTANTPNISNLVSGTYVVTATNSAGCQGTSTFDVMPTSAIVFSADIQGVNCFGESNGSINLTISGGIAPYTVDWTGPGGFTSAATTLNDLIAGSYTVTVTDDFGCVVQATYNVPQPAVLTLGLTANDISCFGAADGSATGTASGGSAPYTFSWTGPGGFNAATAAISDLIGGSYTLTIEDVNGCTTEETVDIDEPAELQVTLDITEPACTADNGVLTANVTGGTVISGYTYQWTNSLGNVISTAATVFNLPPGIYTILVTDNAGCEASTTLQLFRETINLSASLSNAACAGEASGSISVTPTSGTPPFTYAWTGPNGFSSNSPSISNLLAGSYVLQVNDDAGCVLNEVYDVEEPLALSATATVVPEGCPGATNGQVTLVVTGGSPGFFFAWTGPNGFTAAAAQATGLEAGDYNIDITDANGCSTSIVVTVGLADELVIALTGDNPACFEELSGSITSNISGGEQPYSYAWSGPNGFVSGLASPTGLAPGDYLLLLTDNNGCEATAQITLTGPDEIEVTIDVTNATCLEANGGAEATATGGTGALSYSWTNGGGVEVSNSNVLANVVSGVYGLEVTDEAGCSFSALVSISDANGAVNGTVTPVTCPDGSDGAIAIVVIDGLPPYTYSWTGDGGFSSTLQDISGLTAGSYAVAVTDDNGCLYAASFEVTDPAPISATAAITGVTCAGSDGTIALTVNGGTGPYGVMWTGPNGFTASGTNLSNLEIGSYAFIITDDNGCMATGNAEVIEALEIVVTAAVTPPLCGGINDGSISLNITGGSAPYSVLWSGPDGFTAASPNIDDLAGGEYTLQVTDDASCVLEATYTLTQPDAIAIAIDAVQPDCGQDNGELLATVTGGTAAGNYALLWSDIGGNPLGTAALLENLEPGTYTVLATDDNGCQATEIFLLTNPGIGVSTETTPVTCIGDADGSISLTITSENPPFTVAWTGPAGFISGDHDIASLMAGTYTYTVTASDGCEVIGTAEVGQPAPITATAEVTPACFGESSGAIALEVLNAVPVAIVTWSDTSGPIGTGAQLNGLGVGDYTFEIVDGNGCTFSDVVTVTENPELTVSIATTDLVCAGVAAGSIEAGPAGGTAPYTLSWAGPDGFTADGSLIDGLFAGSYTLTVTDAVGCTLTEIIELAQPEALEAAAEVILPNCDNLGGLSQIALSTNGGTAPYAASWTGPGAFAATGFQLNNLEPGQYNYEITDAAGCTLNGSVVVIETNALGLIATVVNVTCNGQADGSISTQLFGGAGSISIAWTGPNGFTSDLANPDGLVAGEYTAQLTDSVGCTFSSIVTVNEPAALTAVAEVTDAGCNVSADGAIDLQVAGGTPPYSVEWTGPDGFTSTETDLENIFAGTYNAAVTDANGCAVQASFEVDYILEIAADAGGDIAFCASAQPFAIQGVATGGDMLGWTNLEGDELSNNAIYTFTNAAVGSFTLIFSVSNGLCSTTDTVEVTLLPSPDVDAGNDIEVFAEQLFTLGGAPTSTTAIAYSWSPMALGNFDPTLSNPSGTVVESTTFTVTVADANGCINTDSVRVRIVPSVSISSGFTPNGDGVNDTWVIDNIELFPNSVVNIFNRWGTLLYSKRNYNQGNAWDGRYDGNPLPVGTYYYAVELNDPRFPEPFTGPLTIYR